MARTARGRLRLKRLSTTGGPWPVARVAVPLASASPLSPPSPLFWRAPLRATPWPRTPSPIGGQAVASRHFYPTTEAMSGREESCSESLASTFTILRSSWDNFSCIRASLKRADSSATPAQTIRGSTSLSLLALLAAAQKHGCCKRFAFNAVQKIHVDGQRTEAAHAVGALGNPLLHHRDKVVFIP